MADIRTVIAVTGEDDRFAEIRKAAAERALEEHATLILYDMDAAVSPLESAMPTGWSAEGTEEDAGDRLGPEELEAAGHEGIARQVRAARAEGLDAWGWLASDTSREALLEYAAGEPAARIFAPTGDPDLDLADLPEAELVPTGASPTSS